MGSASEAPQWNVTQHGYMLDRSHIAASRLNLQFYLFKETLEFNIHPQIINSLPGDRPLEIADVGCGTGAWLIDAAVERSKDNFTGFDIDFTQTPPQKWLPSNIKQLRTLNVFEEVPEDLQGIFDMVHVRLFILVIEKSDPRPVIRNLRKLLRPGGWLQWEEVNSNDQQVAYADEGKEHRRDAVDAMIKMKYSDGRNMWISKLADLMASEGFDQTHWHQFEDPPYRLQANSDQQMMTMNEFGSRLHSLGQHQEAQRIEKLAADVVDELRTEGGTYNMPKILAMGRRTD